MDSGIIYWLKAIHDALKSLGGSVDGSHQSDWNESDSTASSYIKNKPSIPTPPSVTIVEGTVATDAFTPDSGQPTFDTALGRIAEGNFVYLKYVDSDDDVYELVTAASDDAMATKNVTWSAD